MKDEMDYLLNNQSCYLIKLSKGRKVVTNKWVYMVKEEGDKLNMYKERLVVMNFLKIKV